jgi:hypothetical protein
LPELAIKGGEPVALPKDVLMDRKNVNLVIEAIKKIKENIHELAD